MYILHILSIFISIILSIRCKCASNTTTFNSMHKLEYSFLARSSVDPCRALLGPESGDIYQTGQLYTPTPIIGYLIRI